MAATLAWLVGLGAEGAEAQRVSRRAAKPQRPAAWRYSGSLWTTRVMPSLRRAAPKLSSSPIRLSANPFGYDALLPLLADALTFDLEVAA